jgi:hypothetical protein
MACLFGIVQGLLLDTATIQAQPALNSQQHALKIEQSQ